MGTLNVVIAVIAVRLILLLGVCGAAVLAWLVLTGAPDPFRVAVLAVYSGTVVLPLVWLASRR